MQFIAYDSDDASEKDVSTKISQHAQEYTQDAAPQSWTLNESTSDDESEEGNINVNEQKESDLTNNKSKLLDAELLFATASSKPKFLSRNLEEKFEVGIIKQHSYDKADSTAADSNSKSVMQSSSGSKVAAKLPNSTKSLVPKPEAAVISEADVALKKKLDDRITAKDRVKRQRLAGQSGVGSDFREWRSEEEMRQRQMFD